MDEPNTDVIQGTLDMLILKTLSLEPMHGFGIARRIEQISRGVFKVNPGSLLTAFQRLERAGWLDSEWRQIGERATREVLLAHSRGRKQLDVETEDWTRRAGCRRAPAEGGGIACLSGGRSRAACASSSIDARPTAMSATKSNTIVEQTTAAFVARGMSPAEARRMARLEVGNTTVVREQVRAYGWENAVATRARRSALRAAPPAGRAGVHRDHASSRSRSASAAPTAIFSAVNRVLFESLPYPECRPHRDDRRSPAASGAARRRHVRDVSRAARRARARSRRWPSFKPWQPTLTGAVERRNASTVSA